MEEEEEEGGSSSSCSEQKAWCISATVNVNHYSHWGSSPPNRLLVCLNVFLLPSPADPNRKHVRQAQAGRGDLLRQEQVEEDRDQGEERSPLARKYV